MHDEKALSRLKIQLIRWTENASVHICMCTLIVTHLWSSHHHSSPAHTSIPLSGLGTFHDLNIALYRQEVPSHSSHLPSLRNTHTHHARTHHDLSTRDPRNPLQTHNQTHRNKRVTHKHLITGSCRMYVHKKSYSDFSYISFSSHKSGRNWGANYLWDI